MLKEKAIKTGELTDKEIESLSDEDLKDLYHTMKRHADFETNQVDFKHAMHLVRLLRMGEEALETGQIIVKRPDAEELLAIRNGSMTYEEIVEYAEDMDNNIKTNLLKTTDLQKKPNLVRASEILMTAQDAIWSSNAK